MQVQHGTSRACAFALSPDENDNITLQVTSRQSSEPLAERLNMSPFESGTEPPGGTTNSRNKRPWGRHGKSAVLKYQFVRSTQNYNVKDNSHIDSYEVSSEREDDITGNKIADSDDDAKSVITVSSSPDVQDGAPFGMLERPWKIDGFTQTMRYHWETMYSTIQQTPLAGDWNATEAYQKEKDREMLMYIQDFPLANWVIPKQQAEMAYTQVIERMRWRGLGVAIYDQARIAQIAFSHNIKYNMPPSHGNASQKHQRPTVPMEPQQYPPQQHQQLQQQFHKSAPNAHQGYQNHVPLASTALPLQPDVQRHDMQPGQTGHLISHLANSQVHPMLPHMAYRQDLISSQMMSMREGIAQSQYPAHKLPDLSTQGYSSLPQLKPRETKPKRNKKEKDPVPLNTPLKALSVPPYTPRRKSIERKANSSKGKARQNRKQAEAEEYPWHRQFDFLEAKDKSYWNDTPYDQEVLDQMAATRDDNKPLILNLDDEQSGKQRITRQKKAGRHRDCEKDESSDEGRSGKGTGSSRKSASGGDPFHSGKFSFATEEDASKASATRFETPDAIIAAAEAGEVDWDLCKSIMICWNPGKKGMTEQLVQVSFRIYDTLITRKQLRETKILTRRAAECIIDFCPDLLWRETLLRIVSEGGLGNKDVRDRFCYNGCYADKATITKRIAAALGQKQTQPKAKDMPAHKSGEKFGGSAAQAKEELPPPGDENNYASNSEDFDKYIRFFGKRQSTRTKFAAFASDSKRKVFDSDEPKGRIEAKRLKEENGNGPNNKSSENKAATAEPAMREDDEAASAGGRPQTVEADDVAATCVPGG